MQGIFIIKEERVSGKKAGIPSKGKSIGNREENKQSRGGKGNTHSSTAKSIATRIEQEPGTCLIIEGAITLWRRHPKQGMSI